jgi:signal transduction histidine kinase/ActR/RegA family two-component response regulator
VNLFQYLFKVVDVLIPIRERTGSEETLRNARIVYIALLLLVVTDFAFGALGLAQGDRVLPWIVVAAGLLACITPVLHRLSGSVKLAAIWISLIGTLMLFSTGALSGGIHSNSQVWFAALAVFILMTQGTQAALLWTLVIALEGFALWWIPSHGYLLPDFEQPDTKAISWAFAFPSALLLMISMLHGFFEAHRRAIQNLDQQAKALEEQADQLRQAKSEAEAASRSRTDFIATVSHEIRTPMNGILGVAHLLAGTELSGEQRKYLDALRVSGEGLLSILGDILDFSKIEAGKLELRPESFAFATMCEECISVFAGIAQSKRLDIRMHLESGLPDFVFGDPLRLKQILINLIGNAVKFTDKGEVTLRAIPLPERKDWVRFVVKDTGIGMSQATLRILFQPYTQADASSTRNYGGTGLGLAICNRLLGLMGGDIRVESSLGTGSEFSIQVPLPKAQLPSEAPAASVPLRAAPGFQAKLVLLAEDNMINRMVAVKILESMGLQVDVAGNGLEAVERWRKGGYDIILMDCQMPGMDGYEATRIIRRLEREADDGERIPIVALTAHAMEEDRRACLESGMDEYLSKPVKVEALRQVLQTWIK